MLTRVMKRPMFQYAWAVNDLDAAARRWSKACGAGSYLHVPHEAEGYYRYRDDPRPFDLSTAPAVPALFNGRRDTLEQWDGVTATVRDAYELPKQNG